MLLAIAPLLGAADEGLPGAAVADASAGDLSYLLTRWQYDRQLAVADLVFEGCEAAAAATSE